MLSRTVLSRLGCTVRHGLQLQACRAFSTTPAVLQQQQQKADLDPVQALFLQKIREYAAKQKQSPDGFVEANEATKKKLSEELERLTKTYGVTEEQKDNIPSFNFSDGKLGAVDGEDPLATPEGQENLIGKERDTAPFVPNKPWFDI